MPEYSSDTDTKARKKRPTIIQKIDYSLSSEEGPLKNAPNDNIYDNNDGPFKFQIQEEEKSMFASQPIKRQTFKVIRQVASGTMDEDAAKKQVLNMLGITNSTPT